MLYLFLVLFLLELPHLNNNIFQNTLDYFLCKNTTLEKHNQGKEKGKIIWATWCYSYKNSLLDVDNWQCSGEVVSVFGAYQMLFISTLGVNKT